MRDLLTCIAVFLVWLGLLAAAALIIACTAHYGWDLL